MYTKNFELPTIEELTVPEVKLGSPSLFAASFHLGKYCQAPNDEFMLCKSEEKDPRKCISEGKYVTQCSIEFFKKIKASCLAEFEQYAQCIDKSSASMKLSPCRNTQAAYDKCVFENLNLERPEFGYFCRPRAVDTQRPKPKDSYERPDFKGGVREPNYDVGASMRHKSL